MGDSQNKVLSHFSNSTKLHPIVVALELCTTKVLAMGLVQIGNLILISVRTFYYAKAVFQTSKTSENQSLKSIANIVTSKADPVQMTDKSLKKITEDKRLVN